MPEKSDPIAHNGKQNVLVYSTWQNLLKFLQGAWEMKLHSFFIGHSNIAEYVSSISVSQTANDIEWLYE